MDTNRNTGNWNTGYCNAGNRNTGNWNTGYWNTGNRNTGDWNTGNRNTGNRNTGDWNTGNRNTGDRNTGNWNTGDWNTGDWNTGNRNTGNRNTGDWNTGNRNTGYCNTIEPKEYLFFNRPCSIDRDSLNFPDFFYFLLTEWVSVDDMTDQEKIGNPTFHTTGGYLKTKGYQQAWRESWDKADLEDRKKCLTLPNWDNEIFKEISGIDVEKELNTKKETIKIGDLEYDKAEIEAKLKDVKPIK